MTGEVCVVTGAADGIGRATAVRLRADGWSVVGVDLKPCAEADVSIEGDVADRDTSRQAAEAALRLGRLAGWVNNAGIELDEPAHLVTPEHLRRQIDVNLVGTMWGCSEATARFLELGGGALVCVSSIQGIRGFPGAFAYAATKGAINALTRQLAIEYAPARIRANAVLPGQVRSAMTLADWDSPEAERSDLGKQPWGRVAEPEEVASVVAFLLSADAAFVSGQEIVVDGAASARCTPYPPHPDVLRNR